MQFIDPALEAYCQKNSSDIPSYLNDLERETHLKTLAPQMLSGPLQGRFLAFVSKMIRPKYIFEVGTFTGYASLCLAEGLAEGGRVITVEANDEVAVIARDHINRSPFADRIQSIVARAEEVIPGLEEKLDLVFIDGGKQFYADHYDLLFEKVNTGGYILADNVLWSGKVLEENSSDTDTQFLQAFNEKIKNDPRVEQVMLPLRDGVTVIRKMRD